MTNSSAPDETQPISAARPHTRVHSSGNQSGSSPSPQTSASNNISNPIASSTPTASNTALPRISSNAAASSANLAPGLSHKPTTSNSSLRPSITASVSGQAASPGSSRATPSTTSSSTTSTAIPPRRDTFGTSQAGTFEPRTTASSYLSTAHGTPSSASSSSLFGFLGNSRPAADDSSVNQPYGWRAMSASNPSFNYNSSPATTSVATAAPSASTSETTNVYNSQRSLAPSQARPAITSFLATGQGGYAWNTLPSRGATVGALQQMHQQQQQQQHSHNLVGSPARSHALVNGTSPPWLGNPQGQYGASHSSNITGSTSGWTLADPTASGAWAKSGKLCSGFEENQVVSFTWVISEAILLRDEVEKSPLPSEGGRSISAGAGKSEVWTTQPIFGDGKWKLELVRTSRPGAEVDPTTDEQHVAPDLEEGKEIDAPHSTTVLSVYLTNLVLDYSAADLEIPANIMIGIKPVQCRSRSSRSGSWIWQEFVHNIFRRENEYYECHRLPSLSDILQDPDIERQDAFSLTIQISTGPRAAAKVSEQGLGRISDTNQASPFIFQDNQLVHHSLIKGLERLLDCRGTGDVVLIVRERGVVRRQRRTSDDTASQDEVWTRPVGTPMFDWAQSQEDVQVVVRDRLLWAHSSILSARSEFFRDMLQSNFAEGQEQEIDIGGGAHGATIQIQGRKVRTLRINDADFTTIYWLLRYLYLEEVEFISNEDVRCAALDDDWMAAGQTTAEDGQRMAVWHWTPLSQVESAFEAGQGHSVDTSTFHGRSQSRHRQASTSGPTSPDVPAHLQHNPTSPTRGKSSAVPHEIYGSHQRRVASDRETRLSARNSVQEAPLPDTQGPSTTAQQDGNLHQSTIFLDPHLHPCEKPPPASALAIYRLAHQYHQEGLVHLAKVQLIGSLTPHTAFPTLLATNLYSDLYEHVKAYVLDKWDLVSQTSEFERCCDEVSAGEWGVEAGRALRLFMRSLLSPNRAR